MIGSARKVSVTIETAVKRNARSARFIADQLLPWLHAREEAVRAQAPLTCRAQHRLDERPSLGLVPASGDDADPVLHLRLGPGRHPDHLDLARHGLRVGRVDEARVSLAERDLREHLADV